MVEVNHYHERELVHLVCERDRAEQAGEPEAVKRIEKRIQEHYGYRTVPMSQHQMGKPRLVK